MEETEKIVEQYILVAAGNESTEAMDKSLDELDELVKTAGGESVGKLIQSINNINPGTYLGKGKIEELAVLMQEKGATGIVTDDELSPAQMDNLAQILDCKVIDRTTLILDIFAQHAVTSEGKIQVEMATLMHRLKMLTGRGVSMSRLGGGIGTRGPGEKKLEQDRRVIRDRVSHLRHELKEMKEHRDVTRKRRKSTGITEFAIVGYTNAGKSTLLNALTGDNILAEDMLFATLDTTTRKFIMASKHEVLLTDTVGFINKLPHGLVDAFKGTLEAAGLADYLIHVVDASDPEYLTKMKTVYNTLDELGVKEKKIITLFNKMDKVPEDERFSYRDDRAELTLRISAKEKWGLEDISAAIEEMLSEDMKEVDTVLAYKDAALLENIRRNGEILLEEYTENGIHIQARVPRRITIE